MAVPAAPAARLRLLATSAGELADVPAVRPHVLAVSLVAYAGWLAVVWWWLFRQGWLTDLARATGGVVSATLVATVAGLAIQLAIIVGLGRLRLRDVGLRPRVIAGIAIVAALWALAQLIAWVAGGAVVDPYPQTGELVAQVFGNAPKEEVVWRGFLCVQMALVARRWLPVRWAWLAGIAVSQELFALSHIPMLLDRGVTGAALVEEVARLSWFAVICVLYYVRTGNLGIVIGIHVLANEPYTLVEGQRDIFIGLCYALLFVWPYLPGVQRARSVADRRGHSTEVSEARRRLARS